MQELVTCAAQPETSLVQFSNPNWPSVIIFASASQFHVYLLRFAQILHQTKNENGIGCNLRLHKAGYSGKRLFAVLKHVKEQLCYVLKSIKYFNI